MAFTSVKNEQNDGLMKEGEYEVIVAKCEERSSDSGAEWVNFDFVVRSDVEQEYQRKHIFKSFFKNDGVYPLDKMGKYANALGIESGAEYELEDLVGKTCIAVIRHYNKNDGTEAECIFYTKETAHPRTIETLSQAEFVEIESEEIPF